MADLIDRATLIKILKTGGYWEKEDLEVAIACVEQTPTVDAVPVVRGRWLPVDEKNDAFDCSECDSMVSNKFNYCPHCGSYNGGGGK